MIWPRDGRSCPPRDIVPRLEAQIDPQRRHRVLLAWVLDGYKWKRDQRKAHQARPVLWATDCATDLSPGERREHPQSVAQRTD